MMTMVMMMVMMMMTKNLLSPLLLRREKTEVWVESSKEL